MMASIWLWPQAPHRYQRSPGRSMQATIFSSRDGSLTTLHPCRAHLCRMSLPWCSMKRESVPSCGLLTASLGGKGPAFIKLVGSDPGVDFPQCLSIPAITPFKRQNKEYIVIEYLLRETRDDVDRHVHYLVHSEAHSFVTDKLLTEAVRATTAGKGAAGSPWSTTTAFFLLNTRRRFGTRNRKH